MRVSGDPDGNLIGYIVAFITFAVLAAIIISK